MGVGNNNNLKKPADCVLSIDGQEITDFLGITITITNNGATLSDGITWTYSGTGTFLGLSTTQGATTPDSDLEVGDAKTYSGSDVYLYSVASQTPAITDLTGYVWTGNATIQYNSNFPTYNINYKAYYNNGANYDNGTSLYMARQEMDIPVMPGDPLPVFYGLCGSGIYNFSGGFFSSCIYEGNATTTMTPTTSVATLEYIEFTGGTDATNSTLIAWLEANGTLTAPIQANTYNLTHTLTNLTKGNITLQITPDTNYTYPTSLTISNGTIVSYDNTTGIAVISGDDTTIVSGECVEQPSGYSGNITSYNYPMQRSAATAIKFDTPPTSANDYDSYVNPAGTITGLTSYTNKTKVYVWSPVELTSYIIINGNQYNGSSTYQSAEEITLTGNYNIALIYNGFQPL